jgi:membrane fusion protein (multidrug efflux system)
MTAAEQRRGASAPTSKEAAEDQIVTRFPGKADGTAPAASRRSGRRIGLILALPLLLALVGGYFWITGGRYVSTDNAYVQQDKVTIVPQVAGRIVEVGAVENQEVARGDVLFRIDDSEYAVAVQQQEAEVASARLEVERLKADFAKALSDQRAADQALTFASDTFNRQEELQKRGVVAQSALDKTRLDLQQAEASARAADQAVVAAKAALAGDPDIATDRHPVVLEALAKLAKARLDLSHTTVTAPAAGIVSQTERMQVGQYVATGSSVMSLVETGRSWIEANFKETDLTYLHTGQQAAVEIDTFPGADIKGRVESLGAGTGAEFSLLPAQNATGNWVKVVQRIPVRIALDRTSDVPPLRTGMSASVTVDTGRTTILGFVVGALTGGRAHAKAAQDAGGPQAQ